MPLYRDFATCVGHKRFTFSRCLKKTAKFKVFNKNIVVQNLRFEDNRKVQNNHCI